MTAYLSPPKSLSDEDRHILSQSREAFYWKSIKTAVHFGLDPTIPRFLGGLGLPGAGRTGALNHMTNEEYDIWCGRLRSIMNSTSFDELIVPNPIRSLDLSYLSQDRPKADDEMYLRYFKPAYNNREKQFYRFVVPPTSRTAFLGPENVGFRCNRALSSIGLEGVVRERNIIVKGPAVKEIKPEARYWLRA